jgi:uncharacterized protein YbjT (DUF2867 family)
MRSEPILLLGATGFVGRHLYPALRAAGWSVRCGTRDLARARQLHPDRDWVELDVNEPGSLIRAATGCRAAYFLVHQLDAGPGYADREVQAVKNLRRAAKVARLERIVYLGGVAPCGRRSRHLAARLATGELLREGPVPCLELRAAMIIGPGSRSWNVVRDLAAHLPLMVLPAWLEHASWPVAIEDVVTALVAALELDERGWFDLPGPERITHRELLIRAALLLRQRPPRMVSLPWLTPRLSSYWIALVTRVDRQVAGELVAGLLSDLDPSGRILWDRLAHRPGSLDAAMARAIAAESGPALPQAGTTAHRAGDAG